MLVQVGASRILVLMREELINRALGSARFRELFRGSEIPRQKKKYPKKYSVKREKR